MELVRPPPLPSQSVRKLAMDHFPFQSVDTSTIRELDSYDDRNYHFHGTLAAGNERPIPSEYVLKVLNWRESKFPGLVDGFNKVMLHLRDKGYRCSYPIPISLSGGSCTYSVLLTERELDTYARLDHTSLDTESNEDVNCKQNVKKFDVRVLVYVQGQPMGKMKTPPSKQLLYSTGQYVGGIDHVLQVALKYMYDVLSERYLCEWQL